MQRFKNVFVKSLELILLFALLLPVSAAAPDRGSFGVVLSWTNSPETSMTASWRGDVQNEEVMQVVTEVQYNKTGFAGAMEFAAACKDVSLDGSKAWSYEATATGLSPATGYVYRVGSADRWSAVRMFTTTDTAAKTLTFAYMGDVQPVNDSAAEFALWGKLAESMYRRSPELAFAVLGGDIVNSGISLEQFDLFRENAETTFASVPLFSTVGNHESNFIGGKPELFLDLFAFPQNGPEGFAGEFYSFDVASCHILVLNSWIFSGEQDLTEDDYTRVNDWIRADLASSRADWQIVVTHVPVYAVHIDTTATAVKANWAPIFERYGVDLVFEGHQHVYSRSYPMYEGKIDYENGITYIMGVSGSKFYGSADETLAQHTVYNTANYQLVQIDGNALTVRTLDLDGNELDYVSIPQRDYTPLPETPMTRLMLVEALYQVADSPAAAGKTPFTDCDALAVAWAYQTGVVSGRGNGKFDPDAAITRQEAAVMLYRYARNAGMDLTLGNDLAAFTDSDSAASWARKELQWAVDAGLMGGEGDGMLAPRSIITRTQAADIIRRFAA